MPQGEKNRETYHDGNISWHTYLIAFFFHSITTPRRTCVLQESPFSNVHKQWFVIYDDFLPVVVVEMVLLMVAPLKYIVNERKYLVQEPFHGFKNAIDIAD